MANCEGCKFAKGAEGVVKDPNATASQKEAAQTILTGLDERSCKGWSSLRYFAKVVSPDPPVEIMQRTTGSSQRLMAPAEEACRSEFRTDDDFWSARADLIDANIAAEGLNPTEIQTARTDPRVAAHIAIVQDTLHRKLT